MKLLVLSCLASLFFLSGAYAGGRLGNGGNAVVCYDSAHPANIQDVTLFDFWEAKQSNPTFQVDLGAPTLSIEAKLDLYLARIAKYDPVRAANYRTAAARILDQLGSVLTDTLNPDPINDDTSIYTPAPPCVKRQFAVQIMDPLPGQGRFQIDRQLWNLASHDDQIGLLLHEVIYREALTNGQTNSDRTRLYNANIASTPTGFAVLADYRKVISDSQFKILGVTPFEWPEMNLVFFSTMEDDNGLDEMFLAYPIVLDFTTSNGAHVHLETKKDDLISIGGSPSKPGHPEYRNYVFNPSRREDESVALATYTRNGVVSHLNWLNLWSNGEVKSAVAKDLVALDWRGTAISCLGNGGRYTFGTTVGGELNLCSSVVNSTEIAYFGYVLPIGSTDPSVPASFKISTSRWNAGESFTGTLREAVLLPVSGTGKSFEFKGDVTFDPSHPAEILRGTFRVPLLRMIAGESTPIPYLDMALGQDDSRIEPSTPRLAETLLDRTFSYPRVRGTRVAAPDRGPLDHEQPFDAICSKNGFDQGASRLSAYRSEKVSVTGREDFYSADADALVTIVDDDFRIVRTLSCEGRFSYAL